MLFIEAVVVFVAAIIVGFLFVLGVHFLIMRLWLYRHLFLVMVRRIEVQGRGSSSQMNAEAFAYNERDRLRATLAIPAIILVSVAVVAIRLARDGLISTPVCVAIIVGFLLACFDFVYVFVCVEQDARLVCGRIIEINKDEQCCTFWTTEGDEITLDFDKGKLPDKKLVQGKRYVYGQFRYCWDIAPCDYCEWDEKEHPS